MKKGRICIVIFDIFTSLLLRFAFAVVAAAAGVVGAGAGAEPQQSCKSTGFHLPQSKAKNKSLHLFTRGFVQAQLHQTSD